MGLALKEQKVGRRKSIELLSSLNEDEKGLRKAVKKHFPESILSIRKPTIDMEKTDFGSSSLLSTGNECLALRKTLPFLLQKMVLAIEYLL